MPKDRLWPELCAVVEAAERKHRDNTRRAVETEVALEALAKRMDEEGR
jgi:hypothetical protein